MKVLILAGGLGTRISEESHLKPKPMIEIGELPILVHIMKGYAAQGFNDFIILAGYKQRVIKEYFAHYFLYNNDVTFNMQSNERIIHNKSKDEWKVAVVDTGLNTQTGGRVKRVKDYIGNEPFMLTYGDAVADINIKELLECHKKSGKLGTMSCYNFGQSKGVIEVNKDGSINAFREKSDLDVWTDWHDIELKDGKVINDIRFDNFRFFQFKACLNGKSSKVKLKHFDLEVKK